MTGDNASLIYCPSLQSTVIVLFLLSLNCLVNVLIKLLSYTVELETPQYMPFKKEISILLLYSFFPSFAIIVKDFLLENGILYTYFLSETSSNSLLNFCHIIDLLYDYI